MGLFGIYVEVPFGDLKGMISETEHLLRYCELDTYDMAKPMARHPVGGIIAP